MNLITILVNAKQTTFLECQLINTTTNLLWSRLGMKTLWSTTWSHSHHQRTSNCLRTTCAVKMISVAGTKTQLELFLRTLHSFLKNCVISVVLLAIVKTSWFAICAESHTISTACRHPCWKASLQIIKTSGSASIAHSVKSVIQLRTLRNSCFAGYAKNQITLTAYPHPWPRCLSATGNAMTASHAHHVELKDSFLKKTFATKYTKKSPTLLSAVTLNSATSVVSTNKRKLCALFATRRQDLDTRC